MKLPKLLKRNKDMIRFSGRKHTRLGIMSAIIGIVVVLGFLAISIVSGLAEGKGGFLLGVIGLCIFALSIAGFVLSYKAFQQKDIFYRFPIIGVILNGTMTVILLIIYILGIS